MACPSSISPIISMIGGGQPVISPHGRAACSRFLRILYKARSSDTGAPFRSCYETPATRRYTVSARSFAGSSAAHTLHRMYRTPSTPMSAAAAPPSPPKGQSRTEKSKIRRKKHPVCYRKRLPLARRSLFPAAEDNGVSRHKNQRHHLIQPQNSDHFRFLPHDLSCLVYSAF